MQPTVLYINGRKMIGFNGKTYPFPKSQAGYDRLQRIIDKQKSTESDADQPKGAEDADVSV